jgi:hypothetical protein
MAAVAALVVAAIGYSLGQGQTANQAYVETFEAPMLTDSFSPSGDGVSESKLGYSGAGEAGVAPRDAAAPAQEEAAPGTERLIIRTANMDLRVKSVDTALVGVRSAATANGAEIADLSVVSGEPDVLAAERMSQGAAARGPATANVTLRVPAEKLDALETAISKLGVVLTRSSNANDVTEQAIDMEARLKNLRAGETRLRAFLDRTSKVSELLEVERELARVRGEIEAMDAQLTFLKRQAARSTLSVTLTEPGPVVQPAGTTWGVREAVTRGIQAAATLITSLITVSIPLAVVAILIGILAWPIRLIRRTRRARRLESTDDSSAAEDTQL